MGVHPQLPIRGIDIILGNYLAGARVWKSSPPLLCIGSPLQELEGPDECAKQYPKVFSSCAVTRSRSKARSEQSGGVQLSQKSLSEGEDSFEGKEQVKLFSIPLPSLSREECVKEQAADPTLKSLFELGGSEGELRGVLSGYFLNDGLLLRNWARVVNGVQVDAVVQVVVPLKFRDLVLTTSHDGMAGHLGMKKTYDRVLRHFFWPRLKRDVARYCKTCSTCHLKLNQRHCTPFQWLRSHLSMCYFIV